MAIALWVFRRPSVHAASEAVKINVMGEWLHPDDDTSIIVAVRRVAPEDHQNQVRIMMVTRGEGGGNATGSEDRTGARLAAGERGLRRALQRSGTIDIFNIDSVDFFYNHERTAHQVSFWGNETLPADHADHPHDATRRVHRLHALAERRARQPPAGRALHLGRGQGRAPRPCFPEQRTGRSPQPLAGEEDFGGSTTATGGTTTAADYHWFVPRRPTWSTVAGVWTGTTRPTSGRPARARRWARPRRGPRSRPDSEVGHTTQSRVMFNGRRRRAAVLRLRTPTSRSNRTPTPTTPNPLAGKDDAILYGASKPAPGWSPARDA